MRLRNESIACPNCGTYGILKVYETVNVAVDPTIRNRVLNKDLFTYRCEECAHEMTVNYDCVYKDIEKRFIIYLVPPQTPNAIEMIQIAQRQCTQIFEKLEEKFCLRIVSSIGELVEKICLLERGRDDRIVELYKTVLLRSHSHQEEGYTVKQALLGMSSKNKKEERFYFTDSKSRCTSSPFEMKMYLHLYDTFADKIAPLYDNYFSVVNLRWAYQFLDSLHS